MACPHKCQCTSDMECPHDCTCAPPVECETCDGYGEVEGPVMTEQCPDCVGTGLQR